MNSAAYTPDIFDVLSCTKLPFKLAELQEEDVIAASYAERWAWIYEVGCGKTVCSTLVSLFWDSKHTLILCPPIILEQWKAWLLDIGQQDVHIFAGPGRKQEDLDHRWVIMSHAIFRDSFEMILPTFKGQLVDIVVDEAQALKNPASKLFKEVSLFCGEDRKLQMLTATPISKPLDCYSYIKLKTPGIYRSYGQFKNRFVKEVDLFGAVKEYKNLDDLSEIFAFYTAKRTKPEVFGYDLAPIFQVMPYRLADKHQRLYKKLAEEQLLLLPDGGKIDATTAQRLYHKLQQIIVNFAAFSGNENDLSSTFELIDEVIEEVDPMTLTKSKLVIWTYYQASSALVTDYLQKKFGKETVAPAYGKVDSKKAVDRIMKDKDTRILVAQPSSVGMGLNLQDVCSEMLFIEVATSPIQSKQALGRVDRIGQKVRPTIRFGQALGTIQLQLMQRLLSNDDLVVKVEQSIGSLRSALLGK